MLRLTSRSLGREVRNGAASQRFKLIVRSAAATATTASSSSAAAAAAAAARKTSAVAAGGRTAHVTPRTTSAPALATFWRPSPRAKRRGRAGASSSTRTTGKRRGHHNNASARVGSHRQLASLFGACVPLANLTPMSSVVNRVVFDACTGPIKDRLGRVNVLCVDGSRFGVGDHTTLVDKAFMAEIAAALSRFDIAARRQLTAAARKEVYAAPLAVLVTSKIASQRDAVDQGTLMQAALDLLRVGNAFAAVVAVPLNRTESARLLKSKLTFAPGIAFDVAATLPPPPPPPDATPAAPALSSEQPTAPEGVSDKSNTAAKNTNTAAAAPTAAIPDKGRGRVMVDATGGRAVQPRRRRGGSRGKVRGVAATASATSAKAGPVSPSPAAAVPAVPAALPTATVPVTTPSTAANPAPVKARSSKPSSSPSSSSSFSSAEKGKRPESFLSFMMNHYRDDLPKHDFLWCHADISELFALAASGALPSVPKDLARLQASGIASVIDLSIEYRPASPGEGEGAFKRIRSSALDASLESTFLRILLAVRDFHGKLTALPDHSARPKQRPPPPPYTASMQLHKTKDHLVVIIPTNLSKAKADERRQYLELALPNNFMFVDLPTPILWVMDKQSTKKYLSSGFEPRVSPKFIALRAQGGPARPASPALPPPPPPTTTTTTAAKAAPATSDAIAKSSSAAPTSTPSSRSKTMGGSPLTPAPAPGTPPAPLPSSPSVPARKVAPPPSSPPAPVGAPTTAAPTPTAETAAATAVALATGRLAAPPFHQHDSIAFKCKAARPADPATLAPLLGAEHFAALSRKLVAQTVIRRRLLRDLLRSGTGGRPTGKKAAEIDKAGRADGTYHVYAMVYRMGPRTPITTVWNSVVAPAVDYYSQLNGTSFKLPRSTVPRTSLAQLKRMGMRRSRLALNPWAGGVYVLVHVDTPAGSEEDMAQLQGEVDRMYEKLPPEVRSDVLLGVRLVPRQIISAANLTFLLQSTSLRVLGGGAVVPDGNTIHTAGSGSGSGGLANPTELQQEQQKALTELITASAHDEAGVSGLINPFFTTLYRGLTAASTPDASATQEVTSALPAAGAGAVVVTPGLLVSQSACVSAVVGQALEKLESRLRAQSAEMVTALQTTQGANEELTRKAQSVELKNMVTEAVEEVSARHEQATAHLVKSLSAMVNQWSTESLLSGIEAVIRDNLGGLSDLITDADFEAYLRSLKDPAVSSRSESQAQVLDKLVTRLTDAVSAASSSSAASHSAEQITAIANAVADLKKDLREAEQRVSAAVAGELVRCSATPDATSKGLSHLRPSSSPAAATVASLEEEEEDGVKRQQQQRQLRHIVRRRYALWQRQVQRRQGKQQGNQGEGGRTGGLSDEMLERILREQREEMLWLMKPYPRAHHRLFAEVHRGNSSVMESPDVS